jgi:hypothetical protein
VSAFWIVTVLLALIATIFILLGIYTLIAIRLDPRPYYPTQDD